MRTSGASLGATFDGLQTVTIPLSAQTFDIGDIPAGGWVEIDYTLLTNSSGVNWVEYTYAQFSDPLHVDGAGAFSVAIIDGATPMPEPPTGALAAVAALGLVPGCRRRRRAVSTTASRSPAWSARCCSSRTTSGSYSADTCNLKACRSSATINRSGCPP